MYCRNCGAELPEGAKFCTNCGHGLTADTGASSSAQPVSGFSDRRDRPSSYLALAIIVTVCCCIPFGIVSIIYASKVDSCWNNGQDEEARENSRKAKNWALWGIGLVALFYVVYILLLAFGAVTAFWTEDFFSGGSSVYDIMAACHNF